MSYLTDKFKGIYRLKVPIDKNTNDFPRKPNGQYEDIDMYISCQHGNMIFHDIGSTLLAYIPSLIFQAFSVDIILSILSKKKILVIYTI